MLFRSELTGSKPDSRGLDLGSSNAIKAGHRRRRNRSHSKPDMSRRHHKHRPPAHPANWGQWLSLGLLWLLARLPYRPAMRVGEAIGALAYRLARHRRGIARRNLELCFPALTEGERRQLLRDNFRYLGRGLAETALGWYGGRAVDRLPCDIQGLEHLEQARADGSPVILMSGHFMCVELAARMIGPHVAMAAIYKPMAGRVVFDRAMRAGRERNVAAVMPRDDVRGMVRALKRGLPVWYAGDQDYGRRHSVFVPFFGVEAATITALTALSRMSGARVVPLFFHALPDDGGYAITFEPALDGFPSGDEVADARRMNEVVEAAVRRHPEQYFWVHRRFKRQADRQRDRYADIAG